MVVEVVGLRDVIVYTRTVVGTGMTLYTLQKCSNIKLYILYIYLKIGCNFQVGQWYISPSPLRLRTFTAALMDFAASHAYTRTSSGCANMLAVPHAHAPSRPCICLQPRTRTSAGHPTCAHSWLRMRTTMRACHACVYTCSSQTHLCGVTTPPLGGEFSSHIQA
eukprot:1635545-Pyramimonas_sp.AAC.1